MKRIRLGKAEARVISVSISKEDPREVAAKLLPLWHPLVALKRVEQINPLVKEVGARQPVVEEEELEYKELDLEKVKEFYSTLTDRERALIGVVSRAWKEKRTLSKEEIIEVMKTRCCLRQKRFYRS